MKVVYKENTVNLPDGTSTEEARNILANIYPEVANATAEETSEGLRFVLNAGTKGSDELTVRYGDTEINLPGDTSVDDAREVLSQIHPEIANAQAQESEGTITFTVQSGKKGN